MTAGRSEPGKPGGAGSSGRVAQPDWEEACRRTSTAAAPMLVVNGIEAPLDWLVAQVRAGRLDLASLSIVALMEAFGNALDTALATAERRPSDLARWSAWLVMAADLMLLRSQLLAPSTPQAAQDASETAEALRRQVARRAEAAALADWLERRDQLGGSVWRRAQPEVKGWAGAWGTSPRCSGDACRRCASRPTPNTHSGSRRRRSGPWRRARADLGLAAGWGGGRSTDGTLPAGRGGRRAGSRSAMPGIGGEHARGRARDGPRGSACR